MADPPSGASYRWQSLSSHARPDPSSCLKCAAPKYRSLFRPNCSRPDRHSYCHHNYNIPPKNTQQKRYHQNQSKATISSLDESERLRIINLIKHLAIIEKEKSQLLQTIETIKREQSDLKDELNNSKVENIESKARLRVLQEELDSCQNLLSRYNSHQNVTTSNDPIPRNSETNLGSLSLLHTEFLKLTEKIEIMNQRLERLDFDTVSNVRSKSDLTESNRKLKDTEKDDFTESSSSVLNTEPGLQPLPTEKVSKASIEKQVRSLLQRARDYRVDTTSSFAQTFEFNDSTTQTSSNFDELKFTSQSAAIQTDPPYERSDGNRNRDSSREKHRTISERISAAVQTDPAIAHNQPIQHNHRQTLFDEGKRSMVYEDLSKRKVDESQISINQHANTETRKRNDHSILRSTTISTSQSNRNYDVSINSDLNDAITQACPLCNPSENSFPTKGVPVILTTEDLYHAKSEDQTQNSVRYIGTNLSSSRFLAPKASFRKPNQSFNHNRSTSVEASYFLVDQDLIDRSAIQRTSSRTSLSISIENPNNGETNDILQKVPSPVPKRKSSSTSGSVSEKLDFNSSMLRSLPEILQEIDRIPMPAPPPRNTSQQQNKDKQPSYGSDLNVNNVLIDLRRVREEELSRTKGNVKQFEKYEGSSASRLKQIYPLTHSSVWESLCKKDLRSDEKLEISSLISIYDKLKVMDSEDKRGGKTAPITMPLRVSETGSFSPADRRFNKPPDDDLDEGEDDTSEKHLHNSKLAPTNTTLTVTTNDNASSSASFASSPSISSSPVNSNFGSPLRFVHSRINSDENSDGGQGTRLHNSMLKSIHSESELLSEQYHKTSSRRTSKTTIESTRSSLTPPIVGSVPNQSSQKSSTRASASYSAARVKYEKNVRRYYYQLTVGCKDPACNFKLCASCVTGGAVKLTADASAIMAVQLASRPKQFFCPRIPLEPEVNMGNALSGQNAHTINIPTAVNRTPSALALFGSSAPSGNHAQSTIAPLSSSIPRTFSSGMLFRNESQADLASISESPTDAVNMGSPIPSQPFMQSLLSSSPFASIFQENSQNNVNSSDDTSDSDQQNQSELQGKRNSSYFGINVLNRIMGTSWSVRDNSAVDNDKLSASLPRPDISPESQGSSPLGGMRTKSLMDLPSLLSASVGFTTRTANPPSTLLSSTPQRAVSPSNSSSNVRVSALTQALKASNPQHQLAHEQNLDGEEESDDGEGDDFLYIKKRNTSSSIEIDHITLSVLKEYIDAISSTSEEIHPKNNDRIDTDKIDTLLDAISNIFSRSEALNKSFLANDNSTNHPSGLDIPSIRESYKLILSLVRKIFITQERYLHSVLQNCERVTNELCNALEILLAKLELNIRNLQSATAPTLRQFIILLENPLLQDKNHHESLLKKLCIIIGALRSRPKQILIEWLSRYDEESFQSLINIFQQYIELRYVSGLSSVRPDESIIGAVKALSMLYYANEFIRSHRIAAISSFYNDSLSRNLNFKEEYKIWKRSITNKSPNTIKHSRLSGLNLHDTIKGSQIITEFSFFNFPFLFDPVSKTRILHIDAMIQMSAEFEEAFVHQAFVIHAQRFLPDSPSVTQLENGMRSATNPYLVLSVRRMRLVHDTLEQLSRIPAKELKKPLKIRFVAGGEEGMDQGGVQKEFFQVLINQLLEPGYGLFITEEETKYVWINGASLESERTFELVGTVVGLALYNGVMLGVDFPLIIYRKLLDEEPDLDDIKQAFPSLGKGLQQLLDWDDGDVADVFMRTFEISYDVYGKVRTFPLVDGGSDILVSNSNRQQYVKLYIHHYATESVKRQFNAFKRGFSKVCGGNALKMCRPEELELLICGSTTSEIDFTELQNGATYDDGYGPNHPTIIAFWDIVNNEFNIEQKRKLLSFVTASDRVPLRGLGNLTFVVQRNGPDTDRLPTALTCFGRLLLPQYESREKMKERLVTAIENAKGFGLV